MGNINAGAANAPKFVYEDSVDESKTRIFQGRGNMYQVVVQNNSASDVFIQFYDAADVGDVTVGTNIVDEYRVSASGSFGVDLSGNPWTYFGLGCVIAVVSARGGTSTPASPASVNARFYNMKSFG